MGRLHDVDAISSVSGGSFAALYYALSCDAVDSECRDRSGWVRPRWNYLDITRHMETNYLLPFVATRYLPDHLALNLTTHHGSNDDLADVLSNRFLNETTRTLTFLDLEAKRPNLILNSTNMTQTRQWFDEMSDIPKPYQRPLSDEDAQQFAFMEQYFRRILSDLNKYPLRDALVASAAFPLIVDQPSLRHYRLRDLRELRPDARPSEVPSYVVLFDGGVHDNWCNRIPVVLAMPIPKHCRCVSNRCQDL